MGTKRLMPLVALAVVLVVACGEQPNSNRSEAPLGSGPPVGSGIQSGKLTAYTDNRNHVRIGTPGPMRPQSDGSAVFSLEHERMVVTVVQGTKAADPAALADADAASLGSSLRDFQIRSPRTEVTIAGKRVVRFTYAWTGEQGRGGVIRVSTVRYYIQKDQSTLAVITYGDDAKEFDIQEADGIAETFGWL